jgi:hypothetical protein
MESGREQSLDKRDPRLDADLRLLVLKAVARADLDDAHLIGHIDLYFRRFDLGQLDAFADDVADLALDSL